MKVDSIVFDLDGTLWNTCPACAVAWNNVLQRCGIPFREIHADDVSRVTGLPHEECIRLTFRDLPEHQILTLVTETMTEDSAVIEKLGGELYEGVDQGLKALNSKYRLFIVSNCQSGYIETFLKWSGLSAQFEDFECWGNTGHPKSENLRRVIERNGLQSPVMVGDTNGDQVAAQNCCVPFAFVSYGFQQCSDPDLRFDSFAELTSHFLSDL